MTEPVARIGDPEAALAAYAATARSAAADRDLSRRQTLIDLARDLIRDLGSSVAAAGADPHRLAAEALQPLEPDPETGPVAETTEAWTLAAAEGSLHWDEDRAETLWGRIDRISQAIPDFHELPWPVKTAAVEGLRDAETEAMQQHLEALAHTDRAPRWEPAVSKIAIPPEDTDPYPEGAFATALEQAHQAAQTQWPDLVNTAALDHLEAALAACVDRGWQVEFRRTDPAPDRPHVSLEGRAPTPTLGFHLGRDHGLDLNPEPDGPTLRFTRPLSRDDVALIATAVRLRDEGLTPPASSPAAAAFPAAAASHIGAEAEPTGHESDPGAPAPPIL